MLFTPGPIEFTKGKVNGILTATANQNRDTSNATAKKGIFVVVNELGDFLAPGAFWHVVFFLEDPKCDVDNIRWLAVRPVALAEFFGIKKREH